MQYAYPLKSITPLPGYKVWAVFSDGTQGEADLSHLLDIPALSKLKDPDFFRTAKLADDGSLWWEEGLDAGWEDIYMQITGQHWLKALPPRKDPKFIELVKAEITKPPDAYLIFDDGTCGEVRLPNFATKRRVSTEYCENSEAIQITSWGDIIWNGIEFDVDKIYFKLAGVDIDTASETRNS